MYRRTTGDGSRRRATRERLRAIAVGPVARLAAQAEPPRPGQVLGARRRHQSIADVAVQARRPRACSAHSSRRLLRRTASSASPAPSRTSARSPSAAAGSRAHRSCRIRRACRTYHSFSCVWYFDQLLVRALLQVDALHRLRAAVADLVDAAVGAVPDLRLVAVAGLLVVPVDQVHVAVRAVLQVDEPGPLVVRQQEVRAVAGDVAAALRLEHVHVDPLAVDVAHEELAVVLLRPRPAEVAHQPAVGVPAAGRVAAVVAAVRVRPDVVQVVGDRPDVGVRVRVEVLARLPQVAAALDDVAQCGMTHASMKNSPCSL